MTKFTRLLCCFLLCASSLTMAQTPYTDDSTYRGLGGKEGIKKIVDTFVPMLLADPRIKESFADFDMEQLNVRLQEQFCEFAGGPCKYSGKYRDKTMDGVGTVRDMTTVHQDLKITNAMFNALTEDLQIAMEQHQVPNSVANKLIAKLAPMQRAIVTQ
jgi:hemoglobin